MSVSRLCSVPGCGKNHRRIGFCSMHSAKFYKYGDATYQPPSAAQRFWVFVKKTESCWEWTGGLTSCGYGSFSEGKAHRFSWVIANGEIPKGLSVLHRCDNRKCVNPAHLFLGTHQDNMRDMTQKDRAAGAKGRYRGEKNPRALLTEQQARTIKYSSGRHTDAARQFGVKVSTVENIRRGKNWRHL